ncbi:MAG: toprim protein, partial [Actinomycetota bacterium]|nr:toprim protein [Actinomycetota bacterium]
MISPEHLKALAGSGITPEFAARRGYETVTDVRRLADLKIAAAGRNTPGLLVPQLRVDGSTWGYQYRPDRPRLRQGKTVKYETPYQQRNGLDIPPGVADMLGDPNVPLWITEGVKKADCGALQGLCIVALSGVWNWLTTNSAGGKMALPEWRDVALNGRRVVMAFDGDLARKDSVQKAARGLSSYLATKGARIEWLWLPDTDDKTGLDDYLAEHDVAELLALVKPTPPPVSQKPDNLITPVTLELKP